MRRRAGRRGALSPFHAPTPSLLLSPSPVFDAPQARRNLQETPCVPTPPVGRRAEGGSRPKSRRRALTRPSTVALRCPVRARASCRAAVSERTSALTRTATARRPRQGTLRSPLRSALDPPRARRLTGGVGTQGVLLKFRRACGASNTGLWARDKEARRTRPRPRPGRRARTRPRRPRRRPEPAPARTFRPPPETGPGRRNRGRSRRDDGADQGAAPPAWPHLVHRGHRDLRLPPAPARPHRRPAPAGTARGAPVPAPAPRLRAPSLVCLPLSPSPVFDPSGGRLCT